MKRFRQWLLTAVVTILLLLPLASMASADPGGPRPTPSFYTTTAAEPGDGGIGP